MLENASQSFKEGNFPGLGKGTNSFGKIPKTMTFRGDGGPLIKEGMFSPNAAEKLASTFSPSASEYSSVVEESKTTKKGASVVRKKIISSKT
jgi:hypothetical protein